MHSAAKKNEKRCGQLPTRVLVAVCACAVVFAAHDANAATTAKSYIQNGLVAHWDGIENAGYGLHDDTTNVWTDLKGFCDLAVVTRCSASPARCSSGLSAISRTGCLSS